MKHWRGTDIQQLVEIGYERNDYAIKRATFSVKGDAIEIVPSHSEDYLVRVELWDTKGSNGLKVKTGLLRRKGCIKEQCMT